LISISSERITDELKEFVIVAIYLYVSFTALAYLKFAILHAYGIAFAPFGLAAVKALICAKFVLVGRALHVGEHVHRKSRPLIWETLHRSLAFLVLLLFLNALEEATVGLLHGRTIMESISAIGGGTLDQLIATTVIGLLVLIPFFAFRSLGERLGERNLFRLFFGDRSKAQRT